MSDTAQKLIRNGAVAVNDWTTLADDTPLPSAGRVIVTLARFRKEREALAATKLDVGVLVPNTEDVIPLWPELRDRPLIALQWPIWGDGRAFSQARVLRERYAYKGEIRAVGDVLRDQIQYMQRCGVNAFALRDDQDIQDCLAALKDFDLAYQQAADQLPNAWALRRARG